MIWLTPKEREEEPGGSKPRAVRYAVFEVNLKTSEAVRLTEWYEEWQHADSYIAENRPTDGSRFEIVTESLCARTVEEWKRF